MSRDYPRSRRIEDQIQRILTEVLRTQVRDPRLDDVVITGVDVSRDLSVAWVHYNTLDGQGDRVTLEQAFDSALGFLRSQLASQLTVRNVPELRMRFDDTAEVGSKMEQLIDKAISRDDERRDPSQSDPE